MNNFFRGRRELPNINQQQIPPEDKPEEEIEEDIPCTDWYPDHLLWMNQQIAGILESRGDVDPSFSQDINEIIHSCLFSKVFMNSLRSVASQARNDGFDDLDQRTRSKDQRSEGRYEKHLREEEVFGYSDSKISHQMLGSAMGEALNVSGFDAIGTQPVLMRNEGVESAPNRLSQRQAAWALACMEVPRPSAGEDGEDEGGEARLKDPSYRQDDSFEISEQRTRSKDQRLDRRHEVASQARNDDENHKENASINTEHYEQTVQVQKLAAAIYLQQLCSMNSRAVDYIFKTLVLISLLFSSLSVIPAFGQEADTFKIPFSFFMEFRTDSILEKRLIQEHPEIDFEKYPYIFYDVRKGSIPSLPIGHTIDDYILDMPLRSANDSLNREIITLRELGADGKIVVLDFWARWCSPCLASVIRWEQFHDELKDKICVVSVNVDVDFWAIKNVKARNWKNTQVIGPASFFLSNYFLGYTLVGPNVWLKNNTFLGSSKAKQESYDFIEQLINGEIEEIPESNRDRSRYKINSPLAK